MVMRLALRLLTLMRSKKSLLQALEIGGSKVAAIAAKHVKPSTLELGGKSPQIVFADADLESAINGVMSGIFLSNGQSCVAGSRLIIHDEIRGAFVKRLKEKLDGLHFGNPLCEDNDIGPIANEAQFDKIRRWWIVLGRRGQRSRQAAQRELFQGLRMAFSWNQQFWKMCLLTLKFGARKYLGRCFVFTASQIRTRGYNLGK